MQATTPLPPAPPQLPAAPGTPGAAPQASTTALTAQQVASLRARRTELSNQLQSADGRRNRLSEQLRRSDGASRDGLEQRISVLDRRIVQIEADIAETGRLLTESPTLGTVSSAAGWIPPIPPDDLMPMAGMFTVFVLAPLAIAAARLMWKRATALPRAAAKPDPAAAQRLQRIEEAVDAISIEIERVSEGQRFVTRLLSEDRAAPPFPALGVGQRPAEPVRVPNAEAVPATRQRQ